MKKIFIITVAISFIIINSLSIYSNNRSIKWVDTFREALIISRKENKPIMLDLYTDWCPWCKKLDETTFTNKDIIAKSSSFVAVKINVEKSNEGPYLARRYAVRSYPDVIILDSYGEVIKAKIEDESLMPIRITGYAEPKIFMMFMDEALYSSKNR